LKARRPIAILAPHDEGVVGQGARMKGQELEMSPRAMARLCGLLYLVTIVLGIFNQAVVKGRIVVPGDATATAGNLRSMEFLWRLGIASELVMVLCTVVVAFLLYVLLRPVSKDLALLMTFFGLTALAVGASYALRLVEVLLPLGGADYLEAFTPAQLDAMASLAANSHVFGFGIALLLYGPFFLVCGTLIYRSNYFPRLIGVLYQVAGLAYLANSFVLVLAPGLAGRSFAVMVVPAFVGETSFCLWLLLKGPDREKWDGRAGARAALR
jgi:Domain of unknown function (DUF4386)